MRLLFASRLVLLLIRLLSAITAITAVAATTTTTAALLLLLLVLSLLSSRFQLHCLSANLDTTFTALLLGVRRDDGLLSTLDLVKLHKSACLGSDQIDLSNQTELLLQR